MIVDHAEYPPPEFGEPDWTHIRVQPNGTRQAAYIKLPVRAACGKDYPVEVLKDRKTPLPSNLIKGLDYLGEFCHMDGWVKGSNPPVQSRPPKAAAGRKCALSFAFSDSSFWRVKNTPGLVDRVLCNKCASFLKGGSMADNYNATGHNATLLRDLAFIAGVTPGWMPVRVVPQTPHHGHVNATQMSGCSAEEANNDKVFGLAGCPSPRLREATGTPCTPQRTQVTISGTKEA